MKWLWGIVAGIAVGIVLALVYRRNPIKQVQREFEAIDVATKTKLDVEAKGAVVTRRTIEREHHEAIQAFDENQKTKYQALRRDTVALAKWLTRVSTD